MVILGVCVASPLTASLRITPLVDTIQNKQSHQASSCFLPSRQVFRRSSALGRGSCAATLSAICPIFYRPGGDTGILVRELFRVSYPCPYQAERRDRDVSSRLNLGQQVLL